MTTLGECSKAQQALDNLMETGSPKRKRLMPNDEGSVIGSESTASHTTKRRKLRKGFEKSRARVSQLEELEAAYPHLRVTDEGQRFADFSNSLKYGEVQSVWEEFVADSPGIVPEWFDARNYTMFQSNDRSKMAHLKHFDREPWAGPRAHVDAYELAWEAVRLKLEPEELLEFPHMEDLEHVFYKKHKYCGYNYRILGFKNREEANPTAQVDAEAAWLELMSDVAVPPHYVRLGGRGKMKAGSRQYHEEMQTVAGRLILMLSQRDLKLLKVTEQYMTAMCKDPDNPIYVGKSWYFGGSAAFIARLQGYQRFYCMDAAKYDSSLDPYLVRKAVYLARGWFVDGYNEKYDTYWNFVVESLLGAPIMRDDGFCFRKVVGTTSGHSHNTLIQSIITLVLGYMSVFALCPDLSPDVIFDNMMVFSLGDDNLIAIRDPIPDLAFTDIARIVKESVNIDWSGDKSFKTTRLADPLDNEEDNDLGGEFEGVQFLGKYFRLEEEEEDGEPVLVAIPYRPAWESLIKLAVPEREPSHDLEVMYNQYQLAYMRAIGIYVDNAGNHIVRAVIDAYLDWLEARGGQAYLRHDAKLSMRIFGDVDEEEAESICIPRFTYEQWRDLVLLQKSDVRQMVRFGMDSQ